MDVELPDGTLVTDVPDNITKADLMARLGKPMPTANPTPDEGLWGKVKGLANDAVSADSGFLGDIARGATKRVVGLAQAGSDINQYNPGAMLADWIASKTIGEDKAKGANEIYQDALAMTAKDLQQESAKRGFSGLPGEIVGDPLTWLMPSGEINATTKLGRAGQAAVNAGAMGVAGGATDPLTEEQNRLEHTLGQGAVSALFGGVTQPILDTGGQLVRKGANKLFNPNIDKLKALEDAGMEPSMQAITDSPWVKTAANVMENVPVAGRKFRQTAEGYEKVANQALADANLSGAVQPEDAGRAIEEGLRKAYESSDANEIAKWEALRQAFPYTTPIAAKETSQVINDIGLNTPISKGLTEEQVTAKTASPVLEKARMAFPAKAEDGVIASPYTTYGALDQARKDVFAKAKDLGATQPGTAGEATAEAAKLYGAFKNDIRNQMDKSGIDTNLLDEADKATQVRSTIADKIDNYFGGIRKKVSGGFEITKANEKTPEAAFGKVASSLNKGGSELSELRGVLTPDENQALTDGLFRHFSKTDDGLSKIEWAKNYSGLTDEAKLAFANNNPALKDSFDKLSNAINVVQKVQGFDKAKGVNRILAQGVFSGTGMLSLMFGIHLGAGLTGAATFAGLSGLMSKVMNDPKIVESIAYATRLMPTKFGNARKMALQAINKSIQMSPMLNEQEKQKALELNNQNFTPKDLPPVRDPKNIDDMIDKNPSDSNFEKVMPKIRQIEGGYNAKDPVTGMPVNYGIDQKANPEVDVSKLTPEQANEIYKTNYWDKVGLDSVPEDVQDIVMDGAVNQGASFGKTLADAAKNGMTREQLKAMRLKRYNEIAKKNPRARRVLPAWKERLSSL